MAVLDFEEGFVSFESLGSSLVAYVEDDGKRSVEFKGWGFLDRHVFGGARYGNADIMGDVDAFPDSEAEPRALGVSIFFVRQCSRTKWTRSYSRGSFGKRVNVVGGDAVPCGGLLSCEGSVHCAKGLEGDAVSTNSVNEVVSVFNKPAGSGTTLEDICLIKGAEMKCDVLVLRQKEGCRWYLWL